MTKSSDTDAPSAEIARVKVATPTHLGALLRDASAEKTGITVGNRRIPPKRQRERLNDLDLAQLNNVIEYGVTDQFIHIQTGITIGELQAILSQNKQWWPVVAPEHWTLLDVLDRAYGGALETRFGGPRDLVLGCEVVLASGDSIKCGGKVVKNVTGYDLGKIFIGSRSSLGIITSAYLRLYARPDSSETLVYLHKNLQDVFERARVLINSGLPMSALEVIDSATATDCRLPADTNCMLVQLHGMPDVRAEVARGVAGLLGPPVAVLSDEAEHQLWHHLSTIFGEDHHDFKVEAMIPMTEMASFLMSGARSPFRFCARPYTGRVSLLAENSELLKRHLTHHTEKRAQSLQVSFADESYNYRSVELPRADLIKARLKAELKKRYDPKNILNPLVAL